MDKINISPADKYIVFNKTILTNKEREILLKLYSPIIGIRSVGLYLHLWDDLNKMETISPDFTHYHLMSSLRTNLDDVVEDRHFLEAIGLLKTYIKESEINEYVYELYSPLSAKEFFHHPILGTLLYSNLGKEEFNKLREYYKENNFNYKKYNNITKSLDEVFSITPKMLNSYDIKGKTQRKINVKEQIDFDVLLNSLPNQIINKRSLNKNARETINNLAYLYNLDTIKMSEILKLTINEKGIIDRKELLKQARKHYEFNNDFKSPTVVYKKQPENLKENDTDVSGRSKIIYIFENTSPYDFLLFKNNNVKPTMRDLKLLEYLAVELKLNPAVINVLIDYVLRINNNKLTKAFVETIASQWVRSNIKTAKEAMQIAEKEHNKRNKRYVKRTKEEDLPSWFNEENKSSDITEDEKEELDKLLSEFK